MKHYSNHTIFAQAYGEGAYGNCTYNNSTSCTASGGSGTSGSTSSGGTLTNTGFDILLVITVACTLIFIALIAKMWRKKGKQIPAAETIETEGENNEPHDN